MRLGESWSIRCAIMTSRFSEVGKSDHAVIKRSKYQLVNDCAMLHSSKINSGMKGGVVLDFVMGTLITALLKNYMYLKIRPSKT